MCDLAGGSGSPKNLQRHKPSSALTIRFCDGSMISNQSRYKKPYVFMLLLLENPYVLLIETLMRRVS